LQFRNTNLVPITSGPTKDPPRYTLKDANSGGVASEAAAGGSRAPQEEVEDEVLGEVLSEDQEDAEWRQLQPSDFVVRQQQELTRRIRLKKELEVARAADDQVTQTQVKTQLKTVMYRLGRMGNFLKLKRKKGERPPTKPKLSQAQEQLAKTSGKLAEILAAEDGLSVAAFLDASTKAMEQKASVHRHFRKSVSPDDMNNHLQSVLQHYSDEIALEQFLEITSGEDIAQIAKHVVGAVEGKLVPSWAAV
jgi:hypothetical protein